MYSFIGMLPKKCGDFLSIAPIFLVLSTYHIYMNQRFQNKVALITGGADGIGKGIAERIASEGGRVVLFDSNKNLLPKTVQSFQ